MKRIVLPVVAAVWVAWLSAARVYASDLPDFTGIVQKYSPAVVKILSTQKAEVQSGVPQDIDPRALEQMPEIFRRLFEFHGMQHISIGMVLTGCTGRQAV